MSSVADLWRDAASRYRLMAGISAALILSVMLVRPNSLAAALGLTPYRLLAVVAMLIYASGLLARWQVSRPHLSFFCSLLPLLMFLTAQLYLSGLAERALADTIAVFMFSTLAYANRTWLTIHVVTWVAVLSSTALLVDQPAASPFALIAALCIMGMLVHLAISALIAARDAQSATRVLLEQSQSLARVGGWELNFDRGTLELTESAADILGIPRSERGAFDPERHFPNTAAFEEFRDAVAGLTSQNAAFENQMQLLTTSGEVLDVQCRAMGLADAGSKRRVLGVFCDITDSLRREGDLREAQQQAEAAGVARSRFLANMSHEIRTPMNGVIGMTSILLDSPLSPRERSYVEVIRDSGESLVNIINEILDFSKYESGQVLLESEPFRLESVVSEVLDITSTMADQKGLTVYLDPDNFPVDGFVGDISKLRQVLVNLLSNAIKFTKAGSVTLRISGDAVPHTVSDISFSVTDTGIGIAADALPILFDPFTQEDASTSRTHGGTGLGLAISREIVAAMGGQLRVESTPGAGSTFHFTVPLLAGAQADAQQLDDADQAIVIISDEPEQSRHLAHKVEHFGGVAQIHTDLMAVPPRSRHSTALVQVELASKSGLDWLGKTFPDARVVVMARLSQKVPDHAAARPLLRIPVRHGNLWQVLNPASADEIVEHGPLNTPTVQHRLLLAEDNSVNQLVARKMLKTLGLAVDVVANGQEVLAQLGRRDYDVILMDVQMPGMDGLEATRRIRADSSLNQPWVIALTANVMQDDRDACRTAGMDDFIAKPVRVDDLRQALGRVPAPAVQEQVQAPVLV